MARSISNTKKIAILQLIKEKKEILFGPFQNNATAKSAKQEAWNEVLLKAQSLGLTTANRNWSYARDHIFGQWKSRTLAKRDNVKIGDSGGGKSNVMTEIDKIILNIIGIELSEADGLSSANKHHGVPPSPTTENQQCFRTKKRKIVPANDSFVSLKKQLIESEIYKIKLQILKLERELNLPPSKYSSQFQNPRLINNDDSSNDTGVQTNVGVGDEQI